MRHAKEPTYSFVILTFVLILIDIALKSVRDASPFPPFPKEFSAPKMSFDLTVSFKKQ